jgi:hypothetical protein
MAAKAAVAPRRVLDMMKEATGASDEDICVMLHLCGGDANEATTKLLESKLSVGGAAACRAPNRPGVAGPGLLGRSDHRHRLIVMTQEFSRGLGASGA